MMREVRSFSIEFALGIMTHFENYLWWWFLGDLVPHVADRLGDLKLDVSLCM